MKTKEEARANLEAAVPMIGGRYAAAVGRADWSTPAGSDQAEKNFADAMSLAIAAKRRQHAIKKVSNSEWQRLAIDKGSVVIGERIRGAMDKWFTKWAPIYDAVATTVGRLPPKTIDFRSNVTNRLLPVVEASKKAAGKL